MASELNRKGFKRTHTVLEGNFKLSKAGNFIHAKWEKDEGANWGWAGYHGCKTPKVPLNYYYDDFPEGEDYEDIKPKKGYVWGSASRRHHHAGV